MIEGDLFSMYYIKYKTHNIIDNEIETTSLDSLD